MRRKQTKTRAPQAQPVSDHAAVGKSQNNARLADGQVTWFWIDSVSVPCIIRDGKRHGPVRILEDKLLNRLSSATTDVNTAFQNRPLLVSKYLTEFEALRLTAVTGMHFGTFTVKDLVVNVDEFLELYRYLKSVLHTAMTATGGWVQVNNR